MTGCAGKRKDGSPCGRKPCRDSDPDGQIRCWEHSTDPVRVAAREAGHQKARGAGVQAEADHKARRKAQRVARAEGRAAPVPRRRGKRGPSPLLRDDEVPAQSAQPAPALLDGKTTLEHLDKLDLSTGVGRSTYRATVARLLAAGCIEAAEGQVLLRAARDQAAEKAMAGAARTKRIRFVTVATREQKEAFEEARDLRESMS